MAQADAPVITGLGLVSPFGAGREAFARGLAAGQSAIRELTLFEPTGACERAAEVGEYNPADYLVSTQTYLDRTSALTVGGVRLALEDAGLPVPVPADAGSPVGLVFGTAWGCVESMHRFAQPLLAGKPRRVQGLVFSHSFANSPASLAAIDFGLRGFGAVHAGSRLAGLWSIACAALAVQEGAAPCVVAGAAESLSAPVWAHRANAGELCAQGPPRPYDAQAAGTVPGEGACFFVVEAPGHAAARGARVHARIRHWAETGDPEALGGSWIELAKGAHAYGCAPGIPDIDRAETAALWAVGLPSALSHAPLLGDALSVAGPYALAHALADRALPAVVVQAGTEGAAALYIDS